MLRSCVYLMYLFFNIHVFMLPTFHGKWIQYICLEPDRGEKGLLFIANAGLYLHCKSYFSLLIVKENCKQIRNLGFSVLYFTHLYTVLAAKGALLHSQVCSHQKHHFQFPSSCALPWALFTSWLGEAVCITKAKSEAKQEPNHSAHQGLIEKSLKHRWNNQNEMKFFHWFWYFCSKSSCTVSVSGKFSTMWKWKFWT